MAVSVEFDKAHFSTVRIIGESVRIIGQNVRIIGKSVRIIGQNVRIIGEQGHREPKSSTQKNIFFGPTTTCPPLCPCSFCTDPS